MEKNTKKFWHWRVALLYTWYMVRIVLQICVMVLGQHAGRAVFLTRKIKCEQSLGYGDIKAVFEFFGYKSCILFTVLSVNHSRLVGYLVLDYDQFRQFLKLGLVMWLILTNHHFTFIIVSKKMTTDLQVRPSWTVQLHHLAVA